MAQFTRVKNWISGEVLYAADLNAEFNQMLAGFTPNMIDGASASTSAMQAATDPGESGTESLASNLLEEIKRIRFVIKELKGTSYWYQSVAGDFTSGVPVSFNDQGLRNFGLATSVSGNALTINVKQADGSTAPSTLTSKVSVPFRSSTLTTGSWTRRDITAALSLTVPSGATLGHSDATDEFIYVYLIDNAGTPELAVSSTFYDESTRISTTAIDTAADSKTVVYSTTARTNVAFRSVGRLTSNQTTAGTYASNASKVDLIPFERLAGYDFYRCHSGTDMGATRTKVPVFSTAASENTNNGVLTYATSANDGASFTAAKKCLVTISFTLLSGSATTDIALVLNGSGTDFTDSLSNLDNAKILAISRQGYGGGGSDTVSASVLLNIGDHVVPLTSTSGTKRTITVKAQEILP